MKLKCQLSFTSASILAQILLGRRIQSAIILLMAYLIIVNKHSNRQKFNWTHCEYRIHTWGPRNPLNLPSTKNAYDFKFLQLKTCTSWTKSMKTFYPYTVE
jgi:hypothetical protein